MDMKAFIKTLLCCTLVLAPVFASANDCCECLPEQIQMNEQSCERIAETLGAYCPEQGDRVYGAIGYEMRYTDYGVEADFDQRLRFAVNYFSQLSDNLSLHFGISDRFDGLPNGDPFGFERDIADKQRDMRIDQAYVRSSY